MKILIIGASILQLPAIKKAKEMGYYVGVVDYDSNALGISYADEYFNVSTIDVDGVVKVAQKFKPDGIMTLATDMPMRAIAKACEVCNLPGISYNTAVKATDKGEMIKAFDTYGVEHPWYYIAPDQVTFYKLIDKMTYPCIMKPIDNAGSRGVVLCHNADELISGYRYSYYESRSGAVIIEEYLQGPEFSIEVMVVDGKPHVLQITDKLTSGAPYFVEMGHSQPTKQDETNKEKIKKLACRACEAVGINCGPAHVEMIFTKDGPKMVELGARMGGDCITTHLVPLSTGIDMVKATIDIACGNRPDIKSKFNKGSAIRYFDTPVGILKAITGIEAAKKIEGVQEIHFIRSIGEIIGEISSSVDRVGFVISQGRGAQDAVDICSRAINAISIVIR